MNTKRWVIALTLMIALAALPAMALAGIGPLAPDHRKGDDQDSVPPVDAQRKVQPAPIEEVEIVVRESMPPQYAAAIEYGLPSGCAEPAGYKVEREGNRIDIKVLISLPSDPNVACTMIYGIGTHNLNLGTDFASGQTYVVDVNGTRTEFTAQ